VSYRLIDHEPEGRTDKVSAMRGHSVAEARLPLLGRFAKVFLGCRTKILRATGAFFARRCEGPYRLIQNRSRTSVVALKSDAAAGRSKGQLPRDF
jgi:hypothetical protein